MKIIKVILLTVFCALLAYGSTKFIIVGDTHHYSPSADFKESILYEITLEAIREKVDFVFFTGDLVLRDYPEGSNIDSLLYDWKFVLDTLYIHGIKVYACRGNNDINSQETWTKLFSGRYTLPSNGPDEEIFYTYSFEYDDFLFLSLDQYTNYSRINQEWLEEQLKNNTKPFVFAASHEPAFTVYNNGMAVLPGERNNFWTSLSNNNGKIYFCGHSHFYDHSIMLDGDDVPYNDVHQIIAGTGNLGFHPDSGYNGDNGYWNPTRIFHENSCGYVLVEADNSNLKTIWRHRIDRFVFADSGDNYSYFVTSVESNNTAPKVYSLNQNYPNPFNPNTTIRYEIPLTQTGQVKATLKIYDFLGREIETLVDAEKTVGSYEITWNAANIPSGIYFYQLKAGEFVQTRKMVLLK